MKDVQTPAAGAPAYGPDLPTADGSAPGPVDPDPGRSSATWGVIVATLATWVSLPLALWQGSSDLSLGFTQDNVIFVVAGSSLLATVTLAAGAVGLGARALLLVALVVTSLHLALQLAIGIVQVVLDARPALTLGTGAAVVVLAVALVGVVLGLFAARRARPTALRWVALGVVVAASGLLVLHDVSAIVPYIDLADAIPLILINVLASVAVVAAAGFLGMPRERVRYVAAGIFGLLIVWFLVGVPWIFTADRYYSGYLVGAVARALLYVTAAALAVRAGLRLPGKGARAEESAPI